MRSTVRGVAKTVSQIVRTKKDFFRQETARVLAYSYELVGRFSQDYSITAVHGIRATYRASVIRLKGRGSMAKTWFRTNDD